MLKTIITISFLLIGLNVSANQIVPNKADLTALAIQNEVNEYLWKKEQAAKSADLNQLLFGKMDRQNANCEDDSDTGTSCIDTVCNKIGSYNCDSTGEIQDVAKTCLGLKNGDCIDTVCNKIGSYNCDSLGEMQEVAHTCKGQVSNECIDVACNMMGSYNCDSIGEIKEVTKACMGVKGSCVESICAKIGSYNCDSIGEIQDVTKACKGQ